LEQLPRVGAGDQVQRLGGVAEKDQALRVGVDEAGHPRPRRLETVGRLVAELVDTAVDVGVAAPVVTVDRVHDLDRLLGGGRGIQVGERVPAHLAVEDGEVGADPFQVQGEVGGGVDDRGHGFSRSGQP
jgi:hypothetical protein